MITSLSIWPQHGWLKAHWKKVKLLMHYFWLILGTVKYLTLGCRLILSVMCTIA